MSEKESTTKCLECGEQVTKAHALRHAQNHWGENLSDAAIANSDAKKRIIALIGKIP